MIIKKSEVGKIKGSDLGLIGSIEKFISRRLNLEYKKGESVSVSIRELEKYSGHKLTVPQINRIIRGYRQNGWRVQAVKSDSFVTRDKITLQFS